MRMYSLVPFALGAFALPSKRDALPVSPLSYGGSGAAYFLDNNPSGASIVSLHIARDGTLSQPARTPTGGKGGIAVNATGDAVTLDSLGSQGAVTISGNMLFTVNAGSNTVSMFSIDPSAPYKLKLVGKPASTQGQFPISVTYSEKLRKACVLNGGAVAGVSCYSVDPAYGLTVDGPLHKLDSSIINESTPPHGPPGSAAQVLFNPDSTAIFATIKSSTMTGEGSLVAWPIYKGKTSTSKPVNNQIQGINSDFGFLFYAPSKILLSDPSFGAALLTVHRDLTVTQTAHTVVPNQKAICWNQYDPSLNTLYTIDAGNNTLHILNPRNGHREGTITVQTAPGSTRQGLFDSAIQRSKMYTLVGTNGIVVTNLAQRRQLQYLDLSRFGNRQQYQGMAVWP